MLFFAQEVLTPVNLEALSLDGLIEFTRRINEVRRYHDVASEALSLKSCFPRIRERANNASA